MQQHDQKQHFSFKKHQEFLSQQHKNLGCHSNNNKNCYQKFLNHNPNLDHMAFSSIFCKRLSVSISEEDNFR